MAIMDLLGKLAEGVYDGVRTDSVMNGVYSGFYVDKGTPVKYREGKGSKFFDGKENIWTPGNRTEERFENEADKTFFFQKYGFIQEMFGQHPEVVDYSRQYYEETRGKKK